MEKFKYLGATVTNINDTREEIKRRINMGNACYYSVEKLLSSSLLSKNLKVRIYKTVILPIVLYGCETSTLTLREEQKLRVFENKVLRKIFGAKRDEVTGEWRKLHNAELHALYSSPDIIRNIKSRRLRWAGHVARMGESRNAYRVLVGRPAGKRPLGRPRRRWEDNIKMDLREVGYDGRDWINLAQDRDQWRAYVRAAMNLRIFCVIIKCKSNGTEKNSLRRRDLNLDFQLYVLMLYPLSHTGYHPGVGQNRLRLSSNSWIPSSGRPLHYVIDVYERRTEVHTCAEVHSYSASSYEVRVMERCGLVDKASARRAENPVQIPAPERIFLRSITLTSLPVKDIKSRRLRWAGHVARMGESRNAYRVLVGRPEGKRPSGRPRRRWEDNIKMDLREVGYDDRDWINLAQDRDRWRAYVRAAVNLRSLMLAGSEFQSLGRAIVKEDEYEEVRWDGIVSICIILYNIATNHILDELTEDNICKHFGKTLSQDLPPLTVLGFADDIVIIGKIREAAIELTRIAMRKFNQIGLEVNPIKWVGTRLEKGELVEEPVDLDVNCRIRVLKHGESIKYLDVTYNDSLNLIQKTAEPNKIPIKFPQDSDRLIRSALKQILQLPTDTPDYMLYSDMKRKGLGLFKAEWEAHLQHANTCRVLALSANPYVTATRGLFTENTECVKSLQLTETSDVIKDPRTSLYDARRMGRKNCEKRN
ncbi:hypothetical protein ANN_18079 [Periplaneta americana]|uniref:Reverse transcriptase domain-containing protein n=1 Tax=Periplaneta americana TaxID=6978 RepID=A0ABQ8SMS4_PERAM|nr:hypothetical protein ANN_18079 [Periplaneta americana]